MILRNKEIKLNQTAIYDFYLNQVIIVEANLSKQKY